jgi:hypothetical protein
MYPPRRRQSLKQVNATADCPVTIYQALSPSYTGDIFLQYLLSRFRSCTPLVLACIITIIFLLDLCCYVII